MGIVINGQTGIDAGHLPISNAGNTEVEGTLTGADVTVASITAGSVITQGQNVSPFSGFKNYIINGGFDVWQRGTSSTLVNGNYVADRWFGAGQGGFGTHEKALLGSGDGKRSCLVANKYSDTIIDIRQGIELQNQGSNYPFTVGKTFTVSFYAYSLVGGEDITVDTYFRQGVTTGTFSSDLSLTSVGTLSTVPKKFTLTFTIGATATATYLAYFLAIKTVATRLTIYGIQLEEGSVATPFEQRPYGLELSLCQYFLRPIYVAVQNQVITTGGQNTTQNLYFPSMRTTPTVINKSTTYAGAINNSGVASVTNNSIQYEFYYGALNTIGSGQRTDLLSAEL